MIKPTCDPLKWQRLKESGHNVVAVTRRRVADFPSTDYDASTDMVNIDLLLMIPGCHG